MIKDVDKIKRQYPSGTRVKLIEMKDPQAPPPHTKGTVTGVDDMGSIMVRWDNGSGLSLIPNEDVFVTLLD